MVLLNGDVRTASEFTETQGLWLVCLCSIDRPEK